jgi:heavy metal sensor kinase
VETDRGRLRIHSSLVASDRNQSYLLQVGEPLDRFERAVRGSERLLLWEIAAGVLLAGLVGYWMAGRALRPLSRLAAAAHNVGIANLSERLPLRGSDDELDELATSFNQALARVEDGVAQMRQFSAAMAHELRTPLAVLRGETELALTQSSSPAEVRQRLELQLEEFDRLSSLITQLLTLARAEAGEIPLRRAPVDVATLVVEIGEQIDPVAEARGVELVVPAPSPATVMGDGLWIERLVLILLDNAIKFSKAGGRVSLTLSTSIRSVTLRVADEGVGIAADALPHIFERFFQADPARSSHAEGAGLGLALAKWIVEHHHGTIHAESRPGEGSTFTVVLPAASPAV